MEWAAQELGTKPLSRDLLLSKLTPKLKVCQALVAADEMRVGLRRWLLRGSLSSSMCGS